MNRPEWGDLLSSEKALDRAEARIKPRRGPPPTRGKCRKCGELAEYGAAVPHILGHLSGSGGAYLVLAASSERHEFWMLIRARREAYLSDIDRVLRRAWLDCHSDHVSLLLIDGMEFSGGLVLGEHDEPGWYFRMEDYTVEEVLANDNVGDYTYDLMPHRSTYLDIGVVSACSASGLERPAEVVMKNARVVHDCTECGKEGGGKRICTECSSLARDRFMCAPCALRHRHAGDLCFLPVRNSPRMGRCMYGRSDRKDITPWPPAHAWGKRVE